MTIEYMELHKAGLQFQIESMSCNPNRYTG